MSRRPPPLGVRLSVALYRRLLAVAFPPSFREGRAEEMVEMFRDRASGGPGGRRRPGLASLWIRTLADLARHGGAEWVRALAGARPAPFRGIGSDLHQAARFLAADRGFTVVAVSTLALGVGANTAVFSVVDAVLLRPLPYPEPDRLVAVSRWDGPSGRRVSLSYPDVADLSARQSTLETLTPYATGWVTVVSGDVDRGVKAAFAPPTLFRVLDVAPEAGRVYEEATPERGGRLAILSARLAAVLPASAVPGATLRVDGVTHTVTGVMPAGFDFPEETDLWIPLEGDEDRNSHHLAAVGRLATGVTVRRAEEDLSRIVQDLEVRHPGRYVQNAARVEFLRHRFTEGARPILLLLLASVVVVLVIACGNVTALMLVRGATRRDDLHVRVALGASRARIGRLALVESVLLAGGGALIALPAATWSARALASLAPAGLLRDEPVRLDPRILGFTLTVAAGAAILSGLVPALAAARSASRAGGTGGRVSHDRRTGLLRRGIVAGEVALAVVLLGGAGLLARTLVNLQRVPLGYEPGSVRALPVAVREPGGGEPSAADVGAFVRHARERILGVPGVTAAAAVYTLPTGGPSWRTRVLAEGAPVRPRPERYLAQANAATPGYFEALGIPLLSGRALRDEDREGTMVALVSETLARTLWPGQEALGRRFTNGEPDQDPTWVTVVGVVGDVRNDGLTDEPIGEAYLPFGRVGFGAVTFVVDGRWEIPGLTDGVREAVQSARSGVAVPTSVPLSGWVDRGGRTRYGALLVGVFAALALLLAAVGIYGLVAYAVAQRRREFGVRIALGARPSGLARIAVREGVWPAVMGTAAGAALTVAAARSIERLLFGVEAADPVTMASVPLLLLLVSAAATAVPAVRAAGVDPMAALRCE